MFTIGQTCIYLPNGAVSTVLRVYPDRHRARIQITETGREIDEVAWHDLSVREVVAVPKVVGDDVLPVVTAKVEVKADVEKRDYLRSWNRRVDEEGGVE